MHEVMMMTHKKWDIKGSLFQKDKHLNWLDFFSADGSSLKDGKWG